MKHLPFKLLLLFSLIVMFISCQKENNGKQEQFVFMQDIKEWILPEYSLKSRHIRNEIGQLVQSEPKMYADAFTKKYYTQKGHFVWINRHGVGNNADTLLSYLRNVEEDGLKTSGFLVSKLEKGLQELRNRKESKEDINKLMGQLEYQLTKAYLRYAAGQRYGYTLPSVILNNIESEKSYPEPSQRHHFSIHIESAKDSFYMHALQEAQSGNIGRFFREIKPCLPLYKKLKQDYLVQFPVVLQQTCLLLSFLLHYVYLHLKSCK